MSEAALQRANVSLPTTVGDRSGPKAVGYDQRKIKSVVGKAEPLTRADGAIIDDWVKPERVMPRAFELGLKITITAKGDNPASVTLGLGNPGRLLRSRRWRGGREHDDRDEPKDGPIAADTPVMTTSVRVHPYQLLANTARPQAKREVSGTSSGRSRQATLRVPHLLTL